MDVSLPFSSHKVATAMPLQLLQRDSLLRILAALRSLLDVQSCPAPVTGQAGRGAGGRTDIDCEAFPCTETDTAPKLTAPR